MLAKTYNEKLNSVLFEQENGYYFNQCELMSETVKNLKSFRHEVKNYFTIVGGYIKKREYETALN